MLLRLWKSPLGEGDGSEIDRHVSDIRVARASRPLRDRDTGTVNQQSMALSWRNTFAGDTPQNVILDVSGTLSASLNLGSAESFAFNGVPGGTYTFSVRAANAAGSSAASNGVTLGFPQACTGAPQSPANFLAFKTANLLTVIWDAAPTGNATSAFMLNVSGAVNAQVPFTSRGLNVPVPPGSYTLSVAGMNACGASPGARRGTKWPGVRPLSGWSQNGV